MNFKLLQLITMGLKYSFWGVVVQTIFMVNLMAFEGQAQYKSVKETYVEIKQNGSSVEEIFNQIQDQTEYTFFYDKKKVRTRNSYTKLSGMYKVSDILLDISKTAKLRFRQVNNNIAVTPFQGKKNEEVLQVILVDVDISGKITDENGEGLPGATIVLKGTTTGTTSDLDGNYKLSVPDDGLLAISFVGYKTQETAVAGRSTIDVQMVPDAAHLEEVIVVAYGEQKKSHLTAAVDQMSGAEIQSRPLRTLADGLVGLSAGLNVDIPSGAPEATPNLNIRGFTGYGQQAQPLILVDGVERNISDVNPADVETMTVLKDGAATAIYGSRAPHGIILITTKTGKKEEGLKVNYSTNYRISNPTSIPTWVNSYEWAEKINAGLRNNQNGVIFSEDAIANMRAFANGTPFDDPSLEEWREYGTYPAVNDWQQHFTAFGNNNWFDIGMRENVPSQEHNLNFSGGSKNATYYMGLGYNETQGIFGIGDKKDRYTALLKVDAAATKWLDLNMSINYVKTDDFGPNYRDAGRNYGLFFNDLSRMWPNWVGLLPNGSYGRLSSIPQLIGQGGRDERHRNDVTVSGGFRLEPIEGWVTSCRYTYRVNDNRFTRTTLPIFQINPDGTVRSSARTATFSKVDRSYSNTGYHTVDLHTSYSRTLFEKHNFHVLVGYQEELNQVSRLFARNRDLISTSVISLGAATGDSFGSDGALHWSTRGIFGRFSYNYAEKYFIEFNARRDSHSKFTSDKRWAFSPSISGAWNAAMENFWPIPDLVSNFKLRGSWTNSGDNNLDLNGNGSIDDFEYYLFKPTLPNGTDANVVIGGANPFTIGRPPIIRQDLTWQNPRSLGFGLDISAFGNRLDMSYDWYQKTIYDQLGPAEILPSTLGEAPPRQNNAVSETRGWELTIDWRDQAFNIMGKPLTYNVNFRMSDYIGYAVENGPDGNLSGSRSNRTPGQIFGKNYLIYESEGFVQNDAQLYERVQQYGAWLTPGDFTLKDLNGDGQINTGEGGVWYASGDGIENGFNYPRYRYGATLALEWNGIDLSMILDGVGHHKVYSTNNYVFGVQGSQWGSTWYRAHDELGSWTPDNTGAFYPRVNVNRKNIGRANDQYLLDLSNLRIRNLKLGYTLPQSLLTKIRLSNVYVYTSVENLGFIYYNSFINYDPQLLDASGGQGYPPSKSVSFGINIGL